MVAPESRRQRTSPTAASASTRIERIQASRCESQSAEQLDPQRRSGEPLHALELDVGRRRPGASPRTSRRRGHGTPWRSRRARRGRSRSFGEARPRPASRSRRAGSSRRAPTRRRAGSTRGAGPRRSSPVGWSASRRPGVSSATSCGSPGCDGLVRRDRRDHERQDRRRGEERARGRPDGRRERRAQDHECEDERHEDRHDRPDGRLGEEAGEPEHGDAHDDGQPERREEPGADEPLERVLLGTGFFGHVLGSPGSKNGQDRYRPYHA